MYLLYSQFCLYFRFSVAFAISWFTFLLFYEVYLIFSFLPISLYIFRFSISFIFSGFTIFSTLSSFPIGFLSLDNVLSTGLYYGADKCVSHTSDVEGLRIFLVRYPPEWMNILPLHIFETAIHFAH